MKRIESYRRVNGRAVTDEEDRLWPLLEPLGFVRQYPVGGRFHADFGHPAKGILIEVGDSTSNAKLAVCRQHGFTLLAYPNGYDPDRLLKEVDRYIWGSGSEVV